MTKLNKQCYYNKDGVKKVNCYHIIITKRQLEQTNINEDDDIKICVKKNKIIIEKA